MIYRIKGNKTGTLQESSKIKEIDAIKWFQEILRIREEKGDYHKDDFYTLEQITSKKDHQKELKRAKTIAKEYTNMI